MVEVLGPQFHLALKLDLIIQISSSIVRQSSMGLIKSQLVFRQKISNYSGMGTDMSHIKKTCLFHMRNEGADQLRSSRPVDQRLCFRYTEVVKSFFPNSNDPVCVGPGLKPQRQKSKRCGSYILNAKKPAPGKDIKIVEKNGNVKV